MIGQFRVLVCGGRDFDDWELLHVKLYGLLFNGVRDSNEEVVVIQGGAIGADFLARVWAKYMSLSFPISFEEYKANWKKYGPAAGPIRNKQMIDEGRPDLVVAFPGGNGTANMVKQAEKAGIEVIKFE